MTFHQVTFTSVMLVFVCLPAQPRAQECMPQPAACKQAGVKMSAFIQSQRPKLSGGAASAAVGAFCVNKAQAEVARICAEAYKKAGLSNCASLAFQQYQENERVARGALASAEASMVGTANWRKSCR